jgi:hypothetical protein
MVFWSLEMADHTEPSVAQGLTEYAAVVVGSRGLE